MYRSLYYFSFSADLFRLYDYIGDVVNRTSEPAAPDTTFTSPTSVRCVGAFPRPKNTCPSSDDMEGGILGRLTRHFAGKAIDTILFDQPNDTRHGLMDGESCASTSRQS